MCNWFLYKNYNITERHWLRPEWSLSSCCFRKQEMCSCQHNAGQCWGWTCGGLATHPGGEVNTLSRFIATKLDLRSRNCGSWRLGHPEWFLKRSWVVDFTCFNSIKMSRVNCTESFRKCLIFTSSPWNDESKIFPWVILSCFLMPKIKSFKAWRKKKRTKTTVMMDSSQQRTEISIFV